MANSKMLLQRIKERGTNQKKIAELLGVSQCTISQKINNKRPFFVEEAIKLAEFLEIPDAEFGSYFFANEVA